MAMIILLAVALISSVLEVVVRRTAADARHSVTLSVLESTSEGECAHLQRSDLAADKSCCCRARAACCSES